jgi:hypothetical protein
MFGYCVDRKYHIELEIKENTDTSMSASYREKSATKNTNKTKQKHNTLCVGHHYMQTNTSFHFDVLSLIVDNFTA